MSINEMRLLVLTLLLCCIDAIVTTAQVDSASLKIIEKRIRWLDTGLVLYAEGIDEFGANEIEKALAQNRYYGPGEKLYHMPISEAERKYLLNEVRKYRASDWPDSLFAITKCISRDSFLRFDGNLAYKKKLYEIFYHPLTSNRLKHELVAGLNKRYWACAFTAPIYFRNRTAYAMYFRRLCDHSCGGYDFIVYRKVYDDWKPWFVIVQGDF